MVSIKISGPIFNSNLLKNGPLLDYNKHLNCSKKESKRDVVHRHAIQLRYLFYDNPQMLTVKNLVALMGGEIPQRIVRMHMYNLFKVVNRGSASYYPIDLSRKSQLKLIKR